MVHRIHQPHNDAMVVTLTNGNNNVHLILIDESSSVDVLTRFTFDKMSLTSDMLKLSYNLLYDFFGDKVVPNESIDHTRVPRYVRGSHYRKALIVK